MTTKEAYINWLTTWSMTLWLPWSASSPTRSCAPGCLPEGEPPLTVERPEASGRKPATSEPARSPMAPL